MFSTVPSEISPGRTDGAKAVRLRPSSRRTECRPSSTVIGRLLYIFRLNPIKPNTVIQASECMKSWCRGRNLWRNKVRNSMDGADAHRSCITVRIVIEMIFLEFLLCALRLLRRRPSFPSVSVQPQKDGAVSVRLSDGRIISVRPRPDQSRTDGTVANTGCSLSFLSLPIIIVVIVVEIEGLQLSIISSDECIWSHG